jgi:hypothetical protein
LPQLKIWQLLTAGGLWIVVGVVLHVWVFVPSRPLIRVGDIALEVDTSWSGYLWNAVLDVVQATRILLIVAAVLGIRCWWLGIRALRARDLAPVPAGDEAIAAPGPVRRARPLARVLPTPPRLGNDPFRDPPRPPAIIIARTEAPAAPTPVVPEGSGQPPKILT